MSLTDEQKLTVRKWLDEGLSVADVQTKLEDEFTVTMTYMEVRFLLDDLKATPIDPIEETVEEPEEVPAEQPPEAPTAAPAPTPAAAVDPAPATGTATVTVDEIVRPGAMASGKVTFGDGKTCTWYIDELGRPGLIPPEEGYQPSKADIMAFQQELHAVLSKMGI
jgi:hypothetical protein